MTAPAIPDTAAYSTRAAGQSGTVQRPAGQQEGEQLLLVGAAQTAQ
ncbi:hypothetical protein [Streptomyces sp. NL15-2K]|nr:MULTISPECIES: hypothetical protein [Actinomycetes]WKX11103.1 hypothetical protein Q4V64_27760 [Kutzneria buriramensis]GCB47475.1 hypothetical protein SNL152K_4780 [Streptomyces sp. NL15-2K]